MRGDMRGKRAGSTSNRFPLAPAGPRRRLPRLALLARRQLHRARRRHPVRPRHPGGGRAAACRGRGGGGGARSRAAPAGTTSPAWPRRSTSRRAAPAPVGESAVAHVIVNRARSAQFPRTVCGVVGDGCRSPTAATAARTRSPSRARGSAPTGWPRTCSAGTRTSPGGRCSSTRRRPRPAGSRGARRVGVFGGNVFYR